MTEFSEFEKLRKEIDELRTRQDDLQLQLNRISEITVGIIYTLDINGNFSFINKAVEEILHFKPQELIGRHFSTIMTQAEYERVARAAVLPKFKGLVTGNDNSPKLFDERRSGMRRTRNLEVQLLTREKREVKIFLGDVAGILAVEGYYDPDLADKVKDKGLSFLGSQGIIFDITGFNITERDKYILQKRLFEVQKMDSLSRFAGKIAHEFNNKLSAIMGCAEMLKTMHGSENKELISYVEPILSSSGRAAELANKLFDFSKKSRYRVVTINLHNIIANVTGRIKQAVGNRITFREELSAPSHTMTGNPTRIHSALINLTMNACNAMAGADGTLCIRTAVTHLSDPDKQLHPQIKIPASYLRLSVIDTGKGMDKETVERLLDNFYSINIFGNGMGMGLSNTFACIRDLNGFVEIESRVNEGTTVSVYLPLSKYDMLCEETICGSGEILLIDGDDSVAVNTKKTLGELGYAVVSFNNGANAVDCLLSRKASDLKQPHLVLLDMMLPQLNGCEWLKKIKEVCPGVKVVLYTGYGLSEEAETMINTGVHGFIYKPFDRAHLSQVIAKVTTSV